MASILEQYESMYQSSSTTSTSNNGQQQQQNLRTSSIGVGVGGGGVLNSTKNEGIINLRSDHMEPIFSKNKIDFRPQHPITKMVVSNNQLLLSMENFNLLKIDLMNPSKPIEIDLNPYLSINHSGKSSPIQKPFIENLFIDPSGQHCLITIGYRLENLQINGVLNAIDDNLFENFYYHKKLSILNKLKGYHITSVGWQLDSTNAGGNWCGNLLLGTNDGRIFETHLQPEDRFLQSRELSFLKLCLDLSIPSINNISCNLDQSSSSSSNLILDTTNKSISTISSTIPTTAATTTDKDSICSIHLFRLKNSNGFCILIATRNFFYQYLGKIPNNNSHTTTVQQQQQSISNQQQSSSSFQLLDGQPYLYQILQQPQQKAFKEMPGIIDITYLDLFYPNDEQYPKSFGWLTKPGVFFGEIPKDLDPLKEKRIFDDATVIMYNDLFKQQQKNQHSSFVEQSTTNQLIPLSLVLTKFHLLLLYPTKLKIICTLNKELVLEDGYFTEPSQGMCKDPIRNTIWSYTKRAVYRYKVQQEDRNIWEIYLKNKDFEQAKQYCKNDLIKMDRTICEEALYYFSKKDYKKSAELFTRTRSKSFEEIALKFIELRDKNQEALKEFLLNKLSTLSPIKDRTQIIILLLWLFEIMLNQLALIQSSIQDSQSNQQEQLNLKVEYNRLESSLKNLISNANYKAANKKNKKIIYDLILNHHNLEIYEYFAQQIDDFECLIEHYLNRNEFDRALKLLKQEECLDLYYRYSPILIQYLPDQLINCLIPLSSELDFSKLIPSLVHFDHSKSDLNKSNNQHQDDNELKERQCKEILRFLEYCVYNLKTKNSLVHNYFLALLVQYQPEKLLNYLNNINNNNSSGGVGGLNDNFEDVPYDLRYAARICLQNKVPIEAIVQLLTTMGAYEEAVEQSLQVNNVELAKKTAEKVQMILNDGGGGGGSGSGSGNLDVNQDLAKRLWLKIAKHVISNIYSNNNDSGDNDNNKNEPSFDISMATSILNECSLLKIEDILPYFPEYLTIDHFKQAICQSLESYNQHIEQLREDMSLATESAQQIREEISKVRNRFTIIDSNDPCCLCSFAAIQEQFYSFPSCGHLFHHKCLTKEILDYLNSDDRIRLEAMISESKSIQNQLQNLLINGQNNKFLNQQSNNNNNEESSISLTNRLENLNSKIEDLIGSECLLCGNLMIQTIDKPFIDPITDRDEMLGWN